MRRRVAILIAAICAALGIAGALDASALVVSIRPPPEVTLHMRTSPAKPPKGARVPIRLILDGKVSPSEGITPGIAGLSFEFDRNGALFTKGLPRCSIASFEGEVEWTRPPCSGALVGKGEIELEVGFREQPPLLGTAPLEIFNGVPENGHPTLVYKSYAHVPAATTLVASSTIEPGRGRFGTRTTIDVPRLVGGQGRLTGFRATLGRSWSYRGKKVSLLGARCPRSGFLAAHAELGLAEGAQEVGELTETCG